MLDVISLVRCLAITFIVFSHLADFDYGGGAALILMLLAGFTYAKYIMPKLGDKSASNERHILLLLKIGIPAIGFLFLQQLASPKPFNWPVVALYSNFIDPRMNGAWFIEVYFQINLILLLSAQSDRLRSVLASLNTFFRASVALATSVAVALISDSLWSAEVLYNRVPTELFWFFCAGILLAACSTLIERAAFVAMVSLAFLLTSDAPPPPFLVVAVLAVGFVQKIRFPELATKVVTAISGASLMIYLTHFFFAKVFLKIWATAPVGVTVLFAMLCGVVFQFVYGKVWNVWKSRHSRTSIKPA